MTDEDAASARSVVAWRRTGLVLGWGAVAAAGAGVLSRLPPREDPWPAATILLLAAVVAGLLAPVFLRRAWSVPGVSDDPAVVRARAWSETAIAVYCVGVVFRFIGQELLGADGAWVDVVRALLGTALAVSYVGMLVLATPWRPAPAAQL
ncbi:hypothetical protein DQ239_09190 [Blastococcus sp. TF02-09]|uniref:hypothetical protein n=1 Tax=Blastococcus sp. TF02-09 TaxID=2250576 RepID=UPI000DE8EC3C|nr:hypothetical protein [Blastococcus sp. TF02-9]RBY77887.1 hypothetical protein DQ239_09190 [Blastococcus sp. TF02-9]